MAPRHLAVPANLALVRLSMLILLAHGSRDPRWRAAVEKLTEVVRDEAGPNQVRLAYLQCPPTLAAVAAEADREGVQRIRVLPLFLANEGHVDRDIRPEVDQLRRTQRSVEIELLPAVGQHRLFREVLAKIAVDTPE